MSQYEGYGATVTITSDHLVIDRSGVLARTIGRQQVVALADISSYHVKAPSLLSNGWVQLCVGAPRPELGRGSAPSDPHTVLFKRGQRDQLATLMTCLQQVVDSNQQRRTPFATGTSMSSSQIAPNLTRAPDAQVRLPTAPLPESRARLHIPPSPTVLPRVSVDVSTDVSTGPSFVGFDVETANGARGSICAIGLSVVTGGQVTATYSWLCRPPSGLDRFEPGNSLIHGLTARDVAGQPTFRQRLGDMLDVIGDLPLIAHNAAFDIGALREASAAESMSWRPLTYGCTVIWSRRELPELRNHKLPTVAAALGVPLLHHHDASADASAAAEIALELMRRRGSATVDAYAAATGIALGRATIDAATGPAATSRPGAPTWVTMGSASTPPEPSADADSTHPLFGQTVVITGALSGLSKDEAWAQLAKCGARVKKTVTRRTSVLVVGTWIDDSGRPAITEKHTQARRLREAGQQIAILNQAEMDAVLTGDRSIAVPDLSAPSQVDAYALASDGDIAPNNRSDRQQQVRGRHFTAWVEPVKQLKREQRYDEALDLLLECIEVVERPAVMEGGAPAPWYTEQAAIVYRKRKDFVSEIAILQRWIDAAGRSGRGVGDTHPIVVRRAKARSLLTK